MIPHRVTGGKGNATQIKYWVIETMFLEFFGLSAMTSVLSEFES